MKQVTSIILGSTGGQRFLDSARSIPSALSEVETNRPVLSWMQKALDTHGITETVYIGGYHIEKVVEHAPQLSFVFHNDWKDEGELGALRLIRCDDSRDYLVLKSNIVLTGEAITHLFQASGDTIFGTCSVTQNEENVDALLVRSACVRQFFALLEQHYNQDRFASLSTLINAMPDTVRVDLGEMAAAVENRIDVMRLVFKGKARTLEQLKELITRGIVLGQVRFGVEEWRTKPSVIIQSIQESFTTGFVVVRSSSRSEDLVGNTGAGQFDSVLDVPVSDSAQISRAVELVIESYGRDSRMLNSADEILVQPQVMDVVASGVVFTRDLEMRSPCFTVAIDRQSTRTDVVTSGSAGAIETFYVSWNADDSALPDDIRRVIGLAKELIELTHLDALDIEFSLDNHGNLYLFQVRPLPGAQNTFALSDEDLLDAVLAARSFIEQNSKRHPFLSGRTTLFGNMPDWNPAEMIGKTPRPLSLSLYQSLIGDFHWAQARADIGYRDVTPEPLVVSIGGRPYIDVRASLNSFLPADLPASISDPWLDDCLQHLVENPELHDKLEFEILPTCYAFDWDIHATRMRAAGLKDDQVETYRTALCRLTSGILLQKVPSAERLMQDIDRLEGMRQKRLLDGANSAQAYSRRAHLLLVDCGRFGLRPFSILARYAFIALALLKSLVNRGLISKDEMDLFLQSIPTVAGAFTQDHAAYLSGVISEAVFLERYGHLRPDSYEITSPNYTEAFDRYIKSGVLADLESGADASFADGLIAQKSPAIDQMLRQHGLEVNSMQLFGFMRAAIAGREKAKFEFMKSVDSVLHAIGLFGADTGLDRDQLSFLHIDEVLQYAKGSMNASAPVQLKRLCSFRKKQMEVTRALRFPDLIRQPQDVLFHQQETWKPNFVTQHCLQAEVADLSRLSGKPQLKGKIVLIQAADPGYDWIFSHQIAGLLTEYGGIGSHMAIRAAEFSLPAAIGCGSVIFEKMRRARRIELDCANETIRRLA